MKITLRPALPQDLEWLEVFYEEQMRPYVELTHQWDPNKFKECFEVDFTSIIQIDGEDIGMLKVKEEKEYIFLGDIQIKDEFKNQGIGTSLIKDVFKQSEQSDLPIRLRVLKGNPAIELYERLYFVVIEELDFCYVMNRDANKAGERNCCPAPRVINPSL